MDIKQVMLRGYMSHCIRGKKGDACSLEEMQANCTKAAQDGAQLMALCQRWGLPVFLYIPGAHDDFVQKAYKSGRMTETEILDTDCEIVSDCDFLLMYDWDNYLSRGMTIEREYAYEHDIPVLTVNKFDQETIWFLQNALSGMLLGRLSAPTIIQLGKHNEGA